MLRPAAVLLFAALVPTAPAAAQQAVRLRYQPPVGQVTRFRTFAQTWMQIPGMPSDTTKPTVTRTMFETRTVTAADAGARVVTTVIDSSAQDMGPMTGMMPAGDLFKGITTTQHVDSLGEVRSSDVTAPPDANPMIANGMRRQAGQRQFLLPARAVRPGDTWTSSDTMDLGTGGGGHAILDLTYKLERVERDGAARLATISLTGILHADSAGAVGAPDGRMSGTMSLELGTGRVAHSTTTMTLQVRSPDGGTVPMRTVSTTDALP